MIRNSSKKFLAALALGLSTSCSKSQMNSKTVEGIDISHHQGDIDWNELTLEKSGKTFIIAKATEGKTYQDPKFLDNFRKICHNNFQPGAYHFVRFGTSTAQQQMEIFKETIRNADNDFITKKTILSLNVMEGKGTPKDAYDLVGPVVEECVTLLKDEMGITPYIYTRQNFWNQHVKETPEIVKECPLWISRWRDKEPSPAELPNGWNQWNIWHYSPEGSVPGITEDVDLNKMKMEE